MSDRSPLLIARGGQDGTFPHWLERLGLDDFLHRYPLRQLVEWGWVIPQYRVTFPKEFFTSWENFPYQEDQADPKFHTLFLLWDSTWWIDGADEPSWFLHPFFAPDNEAGRILAGQGKTALSEPLPSEFTHANGRTIAPYADYFYHWQGFALIDVIRFADCISPILNTPDVEERSAGIVRIVERVKQHDPRDVLTIERRWGGLATPMTWLSHYQVFRDALWTYEHEHANDRTLRRNGAKQLAHHLGISADILSSAIKDRLLVLAQDWHRANERHCSWTLGAWPRLQEDLAIAVEWLCYLSGKTLDDFLDQWRYRDYFGQRDWAELHTVLPFEFFTNRQQCLRDAPYYLKNYNQLLPESERLEDERLTVLVDGLRSINYQFDSFLGAFRQFHEDLSYRFDTKGSLDFRELRPLDHYSLLAIRAEGSFRYAMDRDGSLANIIPKNQNLPAYISHLARKRGVSKRAVDCFLLKERLYTRLHHEPQDPIGEIINLTPGFGPREDYLIKAFLCCSLARNYFAHHHYLDAELVRSEKSAFLLSGILVTVLYLLQESQLRR